MSIVNETRNSSNENLLKSLSKKTVNHLPVLGIALGGLVFLIIYGHKILDPAFIGWTMEGDAAQHFLGWHFFRSESWSLPPGIIKGFQYPQGTSLVYTDSIPLVAIPLKLFAPLLPEVFQYHGLWLLLSYVLQGYYATLLIKQITQNPILIILGAIFFLLSPVLVQRSGVHESLTSHWIILAALCLYFQDDRFNTRIKWVILLVVAALVHFYLLVMAAFIFAAYLLKLILAQRKQIILSLAKFTAVTLVITIFTMWIAGYFIFNFRYADSGGFGNFSMNLLSPFNAPPVGNSVGDVAFLDSLPLATPGQLTEGFNYLGFGLILLIPFAGLIFLKNTHTFSVRLHLPLLLIALVLFVISLSNKITFAGNVLLEIDLPFGIEKGLGLIRSTGRMFWPVSYLLMLAAIAVVTKSISSKKASIILLVFLILQVVDLSPWYLNHDLEEITWESPLQSEQWDQIMEESEHIVFIPPRMFDAGIIPFAFLAASNGNTINVGVTARTDFAAREQYTAELIQEFNEGILNSSTLYVIRDEEFWSPTPDLNVEWRMLDGYTIILPG